MVCSNKNNSCFYTRVIIPFSLTTGTAPAVDRIWLGSDIFVFSTPKATIELYTYMTRLRDYQTDRLRHLYDVTITLYTRAKRYKNVIESIIMT